MDTLRKNLTHLFELHQTNPHAAARDVGVSQPTLHRLLTSTQARPSASTLQKLANFFNVTVDALISSDLTQGFAAPVAKNIRPGPDITGLVPLLTSVQAGKWCDVDRAYQREDAEEWFPCPVKHGPRTFCLVVEGESMKNTGSKPSYEPGDIIFVDPDKEVKPGDRVVASTDGQAAATFKQYLEEDGRKMLKALNPEWKPRYSTLTDGTIICGVVIGKWVPER